VGTAVLDDGDKGCLDPQQVAQRGEDVFQKLAQVGRGEEPAAQVLDPLDLRLILAVERPVDQRFRHLDAELQEQDESDYAEERQSLA
jgi:hypothetical protein